MQICANLVVKNTIMSVRSVAALGDSTMFIPKADAGIKGTVRRRRGK